MFSFIISLIVLYFLFGGIIALVDGSLEQFDITGLRAAAIAPITFFSKF